MRVMTPFAILMALVAALSVPRAAEAQSRGTLQATATVVDTRVSFASLEAARVALVATVNPRAVRDSAVSTVAYVSVQRPSAAPNALVVTIDYSRN